MHASTRILILMTAIAVLVGGIWILFSLNQTLVATLYSVGWAFVVLIGARIVLGVGSGFNFIRARRSGGDSTRPPTAAVALAELSDLRSRDLISDEEFAAKRASVMNRL